MIFFDTDETIIPSDFYDLKAREYGYESFDKIKPPDVLDFIFEKVYSEIKIPEKNIISQLCNIFKQDTCIIMSKKYSVQSSMSFLDFVSRLNDNIVDIRIIPLIDINRQMTLDSFVKSGDIVIHDTRDNIMNRTGFIMINILNHQMIIKSVLSYHKIKLNYNESIYFLSDDEYKKLEDLGGKICAVYSDSMQNTAC